MFFLMTFSAKSSEQIDITKPVDVVSISFGSLVLAMVLFFLACFLLGLVIEFFKNRCSNCQSWLGVTEINQEVLEKTTGYKTVDRTDIVDTDKNDGFIYRKEQVHVIRTKTLHTYKCSHCGHEKTEVKFTEVEG
jgi:hypothetical protein